MATTTQPTLDTALARDAMHAPIVGVDPTVPLTYVARVMADRHVHAVLAEGIRSAPGGDRLVWAIVSDLDVVRAALLGDPTLPASSVAGTEAVSVDADDTLMTVCGVLAEHGCAHAIVTDDGTPVGVISTLDLASYIAG